MACVRGAARRVADEAAFFHDFVYEIGASNNEAASAAVARETLTGLGADPQAANRIAALIIATADHTLPSSGRSDAAVLIDADLQVLAREPEEYARYVARVRREYESVPDDLWRIGRSHVLQSFLARPRIYVTARGAQLESAARRNLQRELDELSAEPTENPGATTT